LRNYRDAARWRKTPEGKAFIERNRFAIGVGMSELEASAAGFRQGWMITASTMQEAMKHGNYRLAGSELLRLADPRLLYSLPEPLLREQALAANYLKMQELMPDVPRAEVEFQAVEATRLAQIIYDIGNQNVLQRSSMTARVALMFKQYLLGTAQFVRSLTKKQLAQYMAVNTLVAGPAFYVSLAKSIPILGQLLPFDEMEEELSAAMGWAYRGTAGAVGADITAPYTPQLPNKWEDAIGPAFSRIGMVASYFMTAETGPRDLHKLAGDVVVAYRNIHAVVDSLDDGAVRNARGEETYRLDTTGKRVIKALGAKTLDEGQRQRIETNAARRDLEARATRGRLMVQAIDEVKAGGLSAALRQKLIDAGVQAESIEDLAASQGQSPEVRRLKRTRTFDKAGQFERYRRGLGSFQQEEQ
jgi:hypothetical protein